MGNIVKVTDAASLAILRM